MDPARSTLQVNMDVQDDIIRKVPNEIWAKIFSFHPGPTTDLVQKRLVCKKWCDVIDEHLDFKIVLNDRKCDLSNLAHLRVKECLITSLISELPPNLPIFRENDLVSKLSLWGDVTPANFRNLLSNQSGNLNELSLNTKVLKATHLLAPLQECFSNATFLTGLQRLTIDADNHFIVADFSAVILANVRQLFQFQLPNLKWVMLKLDIRREFSEMLETIVAFLESHISLDHLTVRILSQLWPPVRPTTPLKLEARLSQVQLKTIIGAVCVLQLEVWVALIRAQKMLEKLQVRILDGNLKEDPQPGNKIFILDYLAETLIANQNTLVSIHLKGFHLSPSLRLVNARIFSGMRQLRRLNLDTQEEFRCGQERIENLSMLPDSLEELRLKGFKCPSVDLLEIANNLKSIKLVELTGIGTDDDLGATRDILASFAEKKGILKMSLSPVKLERLNYQEEAEDLLIHLNEMFAIKLKETEWRNQIHFDFEKARLSENGGSI